MVKFYLLVKNNHQITFTSQRFPLKRRRLEHLQNE